MNRRVVSWMGLLLVAGAIAMDAIPGLGDPTWFGWKQVVLAVAGAGVSAMDRKPALVAALLAAILAIAGFRIYPAQWSLLEMTMWLMVALWMMNPTARRLGKIAGRTTLLAASLLAIMWPFEKILRSEESILRGLGRYGAYPPSLAPVLNSRGSRDIEHDTNRVPGRVRVLVVGDSITFGQGVAQSNMFFTILQQRLADRAELILFAEPGWSTMDQYYMLRDGQMALWRPDIVMFIVCGNDVAMSPAFASDGQARDTRIFTRISPRYDTFRFLDYKLNRVIESCGLRSDYGKWIQDIYDPRGTSWVWWLRTLDHLAGLLRAYGAQGLAVGLSDQPEQMPRLMAEFAGRGFCTMELGPAYRRAFAGRDPKSLWALPNDSHPNAEVHALFAREIEPWLEDAIEDRQRAMN